MDGWIYFVLSLDFASYFVVCLVDSAYTLSPCCGAVSLVILGECCLLLRRCTIIGGPGQCGET